MIGSKIKALLELRNKSTHEVCDTLDILGAAYYRKINKNTFKAEELIKLADLTDTELSFVDKRTGKQLITFDKSDVPDD